ncbi:hypothetical protein [Blastopirellula marina]|uniref:Class I SAM-dependent methyltransferase n=1 Tax=Blastopirellula marina TaxID=124 RepID=A0A2S8GVV3_9BACT|nr:hypothetical protein [Blastopirellula marina]PQO48174.1 hypothetical protein C5Y93_00385 [Blastopirellula marina]
MAAGLLQNLLSSWFSKPDHQREIYDWIREHAPVVKIVEIGLGNAKRAQELIEFSQKHSGGQRIEFLGIDMYEARTTGDGIPLKTAHKTLNATGAKVQLVPGDGAMALPRVANAFRGVQLMIISADQDADSLRQGLSWIPRMLTEESVVLWEITDGKGNLSFRAYSQAEIEAMVPAPMRRAA